ncbi:hypothetical protein BDN71DRAFT_938179 [Pleurotus eryngii]|uniref:Uncharacterized protein n=1 Tax=Pleurotus eryngii TaxID=5323 RepID=A0A9P5ZUM7_PLEER|nr:hypothetical protein BDN71DRAFT_938179 [Pleurotus eryngii]
MLSPSLHRLPPMLQTPPLSSPIPATSPSLLRPIRRQTRAGIRIFRLILSECQDIRRMGGVLSHERSQRAMTTLITSTTTTTIHIVQPTAPTTLVTIIPRICRIVRLSLLPATMLCTSSLNIFCVKTLTVIAASNSCAQYLFPSPSSFSLPSSSRASPAPYADCEQLLPSATFIPCPIYHTTPPRNTSRAPPPKAITYERSCTRDRVACMCISTRQPDAGTTPSRVDNYNNNVLVGGLLRCNNRNDIFFFERTHRLISLTS